MRLNENVWLPHLKFTMQTIAKTTKLVYYFYVINLFNIYKLV